MSPGSEVSPIEETLRSLAMELGLAINWEWAQMDRLSTHPYVLRIDNAGHSEIVKLTEYQVQDYLSPRGGRKPKADELLRAALHGLRSYRLKELG